MNVDPNNAENIYYATLAGIGGGLGYLYRELHARRKLRLVMFLTSCSVAAFIGYHMIFIYDEIGVSENIKGALNGLTALLGVEFMLYLARKLIFKFTKVVPDKDLHAALLKSGWTEPSSNSSNSPAMENTNSK